MAWRPVPFASPIGHTFKVRDTITAIGSGCTMLGLILLLSAYEGWLLRVAQILIAVGIVLLIVKVLNLWRS